MKTVLLAPTAVILALVMLTLCWRDGEVRFRTKLLLTLLYSSTWGLLIWDCKGCGSYFLLSQFAFAVMTLVFSLSGSNS
jgi:hypothetical protein